MSGHGEDSPATRTLLKSRLRYHLRCLKEDATDPDLTVLERLTLVRDRVARMQEIERELSAMEGGLPNGLSKRGTGCWGAPSFGQAIR